MNKNNIICDSSLDFGLSRSAAVGVERGIDETETETAQRRGIEAQTRGKGSANRGGKMEEGLGNGNENENGMACLGNVHLDPFTVSMILRLRHSPAQCTIFFKGPRLADRHHWLLSRSAPTPSTAKIGQISFDIQNVFTITLKAADRQ